jgi:N-acetylglucosamine-6-phosphate deacetylase
MTAWTIAGNLLVGEQLVPGSVTIDGDRIANVQRGADHGSSPRLEAAIVAPGLIDLQVNGGFGVEVGDDPEAIRLLAERLPGTGVTSFLPTIISSAADFYPRVFQAYAAARGAPGARALGLHLEGPFLSPGRSGAHRADVIEAADDTLFEMLLEFEDIRLMTLAPERVEAADRIRRLRERGILVSLGHTNATYSEFESGIDAGATMATHLYNAMSPFTHRSPGVVGAALIDDRVTVGLIADGIHSHPASVRLAVRAKGPTRIALVSDMMPAAGMPPGRYEFGGQPVQVEGATAKRDDGTLAGSVVTLDHAIHNVAHWTDATTADALRMTTEVPARFLGLPDLGKIAPGYLADLALFDDDLNLEATIIAGQIVYRRNNK